MIFRFAFHVCWWLLSLGFSVAYATVQVPTNAYALQSQQLRIEIIKHVQKNTFFPQGKNPTMYYDISRFLDLRI